MTMPLYKASLEIREGKLSELNEKRRQGFSALFLGFQLIFKQRSFQENQNKGTSSSSLITPQMQRRSQNSTSDKYLK